MSTDDERPATHHPHPQTEAERMPRRSTQDDAQKPSEAAYTQAELAAEAASFGSSMHEVAGIFREAGVEQMTETEFRAGLARWRGEEGEQG